MSSSFTSFLQRTRVGILWVLLLVLPLQSVGQWMAGLQGHRHVHTGQAVAGSVLTGFVKPMLALLDRLHGEQDVRLKSPAAALLPSRGPASGTHEHGGARHRHALDAADVIELGDPAEEPTQGGVTPFLAWLPGAMTLPRATAGDKPASTVCRWRDRVVAPPLVPPRG